MSQIKHLPRNQRHQLRNAIIVTLIAPIMLMVVESNGWHTDKSLYSYISYLALVFAAIGVYMCIKLIRKKIIAWMSIVLLLVNLWSIFSNGLTVLGVVVN